MTKDTKLSELVINKLTTAQYDGIATKDPNQLYVVTDAPGFEESITNCITEIPQDIKLELFDGTLTLKAGSKVYVPNGAGVFDIVTISADRTATGSSMGLTTGSALVFSRFDTQDIWAEVLTESGTGTPTNPWTTYYNTNENKVYRYQTNITTPVYQSSFPIAKISFSNGTVTSIDQIFNGFGYIGSTKFALPGVKALIPDGRNADGSLKNIEITISKVTTRTKNYAYDEYIALDANEVIRDASINDLFIQRDVPSIKQGVYERWLNLEENCWYHHTDAQTEWNKTINISGKFVIVGSAICENYGVITTFTPKTTFHALDYSDKPEISGWSMPGNVFIDLTLGTSGAEYTAQANGYVLFERGSTSGNKYINLYNNNSQLGAIGTTIAGVANARIFLPVKKGDIFKASYSADSTNPIFKLIYADGEI